MDHWCGLLANIETVSHNVREKPLHMGLPCKREKSGIIIIMIWNHEPPGVYPSPPHTHTHTPYQTSINVYHYL